MYTKQLPESEFKLLFEAFPGLCLVLKPDFTIVAATEGYLKATMTERSHILGKNIFEVFPDNPDNPTASGVANLKASLSRVVQTGLPDTMAVQQYDIRSPESAGGRYEVRYWSPVNSPVLDANKHVSYIIHRVEDVTDFVTLKHRQSVESVASDQLRARAQSMEAEIYARAQQIQQTNSELRKSEESLGLVVKERTALLEKLRELDSLKTQFFSNVSHELRTPLALILGPLEKLLSSSNFSDEQRSDLAMISRNAQILLNRVNDLLDISKLDAKKLAPRYAEVDLSSLVKLTSANFQSLAAEKNIDYSTLVSPDIYGQVDHEMIQRILLNLLSNAFKFVPESGKIKISLGSEAGTLVLSVEDNGPGIPPEFREAIFERFRQLESGDTRSFGGTGLGLSIVKEFVELHGGRVRVVESSGGGARFEVTLPQKAPAEPTGLASVPEGPSVRATHILAEHQHAKPLAFRGVEPNPNSGLVLVVEDNLDMNQFISDALSKDFRVISAFDGVDGLDKATRFKPDLIVTDIMMPRMSGDQMIQEIRTLKEFDTTPIILLTAKADDLVRLKLLEEGAQDYLTKPFYVEEVRSRVRNLVKMKRATISLQRELSTQFKDIEGLANQLATRSQDLRKALSVRDEFLSIASHELKTPLTALKLQLQMTNRDVVPEKNASPPPEKLAKSFSNSLRQVDTLSNLVDELLDVSRIRTGKLNIHYREFDLAALTKSLLERMAPQLRSAKIELIASTEKPVIGCWDKNRIEQVLTNLLTNAAKYATGSQVTVNVSYQGRTAKLLVQDTGPGIAKDKQAVVFDRFERGVPATNISGLGLGLFITKRIVEAHHGSVRLESTEGVGSKFFIELPMDPSEIPPDVN